MTNEIAEVTVPQVTTPPQNAGELTRPNASPPPRTVLLAEDDAVFRSVLQSWLRKWGYQLTVAKDGSEAWEALQSENSPHLLVLDWMMPGMDGPEICRRLRSVPDGPYHYIVLLTGRGEKQDIVDGLEAGADDYLTKPFDVNELKVRLRAGQRILDLEDGLVQAQAELQHRATHDALTGVLNRGAVLAALASEMKHNVARGGRLGLLIADIDHFKKVNDTHGHLAGDAALRGVTERLRACMRGNDILGRYGGEEFLILAPRSDHHGVCALGERLRNAVEAEPIPTEAGPLRITLSLGAVAVDVENPPRQPEELLRAADEALYRAKAKGRNRVEMAGKDSSLAAATACAQ